MQKVPHFLPDGVCGTAIGAQNVPALKNKRVLFTEE